MTSPYHIEIETGVTTHENVLSGINANFDDSYSKVSGLQTKSKQNTISSSSSLLTLDASLGGNAFLTLTEDVHGFSITNTTTGDSGFILVEQDNTASWTFSSNYEILAGDLSDIASITASGVGAGGIGWYNDGTDKYLFVSSVT